MASQTGTEGTTAYRARKKARFAALEERFVKWDHLENLPG